MRKQAFGLGVFMVLGGWLGLGGFDAALGRPGGLAGVSETRDLEYRMSN